MKRRSHSTAQKIKTLSVNYVATLFFVLSTVGISALSLSVISNSEDIRQQAHVDLYNSNPGIQQQTSPPTQPPPPPTRIQSQVGSNPPRPITIATLPPQVTSYTTQQSGSTHPIATPVTEKNLFSPGGMASAPKSPTQNPTQNQTQTQSQTSPKPTVTTAQNTAPGGSAPRQNSTQTAAAPRPTTITQQSSVPASTVAKKLDTDQNQVLRVATVQTLTRQLGLPGAKVEYVSPQGVQKAYIPAPSQEISSLKTGVNEITNASEGKNTLGARADRFQRSNVLVQIIGSITTPTVKRVATQPALNVRMIYIPGDLTKVESANAHLIPAPSEQTREPQALIMVDDKGNQLIFLNGNSAATSLQTDIQQNPKGFMNLVNKNLQMIAY
jgi:hypothetical protein